MRQLVNSATRSLRTPLRSRLVAPEPGRWLRSRETRGAQKPGKLWVTALVEDFAARPPGPGEEEPEAPDPRPLHHHFGYSAGTRLRVPLTSRKDACRSLTANLAATRVCRGDPSPVTLRSLEPSRNGAERTRSQWGSAVSAEELSPREPSPEAARLAKAWQELGQTGWYWGTMTVTEAKEKLKEAPEGTFLIRDSSHSDFLLTISVKTSAGPTNLRIEYQDGKFRLDSIVCVKSQLRQFDSAVHLIDYYVQMCKDKRADPEAHRSGAVHLYLTTPLYTSAPPLQHLCRLAINKCTSAVWELPLPTRLKDYLEEYKFQI